MARLLAISQRPDRPSVRCIGAARLALGAQPTVLQEAVRTARTQLAAARQGKTPDYRLSFESARSLFAELTPARLDLLDTLRKLGPCSVYALAKAAARNYSNVHTDVSRLEELGLVERNGDGSISVPYDAVEILLPLAQVA